MNTHTEYANDFFDLHEEGMLRSARVVAPIVLDLVRAASVIDFGCGRGAWLRAFQEQGIDRVHGLDGEYVERSRLLVPPDSFTPTDLSKPFEVPGRYDLAICLEVAEHLPEAMAPVLVERLVEAAPAVLFSAAVPGQGGVNHVNERMPAYWRELFRRHGYVLLDPIRPAILTDTRIDWWYRQNAVLYVSENTLRANPSLAAFRVALDDPCIEWVHMLGQHTSVRHVTRQLGSALGRAFRRRFERFARVFHLGSSAQA